MDEIDKDGELEENEAGLDEEDFDPKKVKGDLIDDDASIIDDGDTLEHDADFNDVDHDAGYEAPADDEDEDLDGFTEEEESI